MVKKKTITIGAIILVILVASIMITLNNEVRMKINKTNSQFFVLEDDQWVLSGTEYNNLFINNVLIKPVASKTILQNEVNGNIIKITRSTFYKKGMIIVDTYNYDGSKTNLESFPVEHIVEIYNSSGYDYQYNVKDLVYNGESRDAISPESFGHRMKVTFDEGYDISNVGNNQLHVDYAINSDYKKINLRLFDPIETVTISYPLNQSYNSYVNSINFSTNYTSITNCSYNMGGSNISTNCSINITGLTSSYGSHNWCVYASDNGTNTSSCVTFFQDYISMSARYSSGIGGLLFKPNSRYDQRLWPQNQTYTKGVYNLSNSMNINYTSIWMSVSNTLPTWELQCNNKTSGNWTTINETSKQITSNINAGRSQMIWCRVNLNNATSSWNFNVSFEGRI